MPSEADAAWDSSPLEALAGGGDAWVDLVRAAEASRPVGRLGEFELLGEVRGGQGLVYRARQPRTGRDVALKRLAAGSLSSRSERRRFEREVDLATSLDHPGIITVHGVEILEGLPMLSMEWVDGEEITAWAERSREAGAGPRATIELFLDVCAAVQHAHQRGVLHRDLKPSNILVDRAGRARVLDFGLARRLPEDGGTEADGYATRTLGFVGTPAYAPPERFTDGHAPLDARGDVWSLGVVLYELLTGKRPFAGESLRELIDAIAEQDACRPSELAPELDGELDTILAKAMAKSPDGRYATVHAFAEDLQRHLAGKPVLAVPPKTGYLLRKWVRRHRTESLLVALLLLLVAASIAGGLWQARRVADQRDRAEAESSRANDALAASELARTAEGEARAELAAALDVARDEAAKAGEIESFYLDAVFRPFMEGNAEERAMLVDLIRRSSSEASDYFDHRPELAAKVLARVARALCNLDLWNEAMEVTEDAIAFCERAGDAVAPYLRAELEDTRGSALIALEGIDAARPVLENAVALFEALGDPSPRPGSYATTMNLLGKLELASGNIERARELFLRIRELLAGDLADEFPQHKLSVECYLAHFALRAGEPEKARAALDELWVFADEHLDPDDSARLELEVLATETARFLGEPLVAADHFRAQLELQRLHFPPGLPDLLRSCVSIARDLRDAGEIDAALALYDEAPSLNGDPALTAAAAEESAVMRGR